MKEKLRRSKRHMAGVPGALRTEQVTRGEDGREGAHSKSGAGEGASASQSVAPSSPGADTSKPGPSSPARSSASGSPEPNCAICLGKLENKSFTDSCFHMFCFVCLLEWSKVKPECPLCKQKFKSIIHNVRSYDDYQQYHLDRQPESRQHSWEDPDGPRFRYRTTMTVGPFRGVLDLIHTYPNPPFTVGSGPNPVREYRMPEATVSRPSWLYDSRRDNSASTQERPLALTTSQTARQSWRNRRCNATSDFRRRVYSEHLRLVKVRNDLNRHSTATPEFYESNPGATHRLIPWLNRELNALLTAENHCQFVLELIMGLINRFPIQSEEFYQHLQPFLGRNTRRFMEEFYSFAHSPYNLATYDTKAVYEAALEEISDSDTSVEQEEVIVVDSSSSDEDDLVARAPTRWPAMEDLTGSIDRTTSSMLAQSSWDSPTPGPSWDSSPERQGASQPRVRSPTHTTSASSAPNVAWSVGTSSMSSTGVKSESLIAQTSDSDSDSSTSGMEAEDDVVVVAMEKPWQERSPIVLSSEDERPAPPERESKESLPIKLKIRRNHSRRERDAERSHRGLGHSSDHHAQWRMQSRSRSNSPTFSSRCWQVDHWSRSRISNRHHEAHHSRSARSRETTSQRTHSRSRSRESRSRDHRHLQSHHSSPRSSRKRHRTHSSGAGSRGNSVEVNSCKRKKSKHKKHKKHKKHGKHKHKKKEDKHSGRNRSRHRSRKSGEAEDTPAPEASSSSLLLPTVKSSSAACKKHPSGHKASSDSSDSTGFSGAALEVAMEIAVGSTSQNESSLDGNDEVPAEVIAISSDEEDDIVEVVAEVEQQPSLAERSPPMLFCPEELAKRAMQRCSWNTPTSTELDDARSSLFSLLKQPVPSTPLTRADPMLSSSGATLSDPLLSPGASSPPPLSGPFCSEASSAGGRSVWGPFPNSVEEPKSTTTSSQPSTVASQALRYGYIDERTFPSRNSLQSGVPVETRSSVWCGSKPDTTSVVSSGTASVLLPKWTSGMNCTAPRATLPFSSAAWRAAMMPSASSTAANPANSQASSCGLAQGSADNLATAASCTTSQEPSSLAGSKDGQRTPKPSAYLGMLERQVLDQNDENSENASSEDESSYESRSRENFFDDAVHNRSRPSDGLASVPFTPRSPELISSDDDGNEDCWVTTEIPRLQPSEHEEEIDVCKMSDDQEDKAIESNESCFSEDDSQGPSNQAVYRSGQAREEGRVDQAGHASHTDEDEHPVGREGHLMESMTDDLHSPLPDDNADEHEKSEANVCPDGDDSESEDRDNGDISDTGEHNSLAAEVGDVGVSGKSFQDCLDVEEEDTVLAAEASDIESTVNSPVESPASLVTERESTVNSLAEPSVSLETEGEEGSPTRNGLLEDDLDVDADDSEDEGGLGWADEGSGWQASPADAGEEQHKGQCDSSDEDSS